MLREPTKPHRRVAQKSLATEVRSVVVSKLVEAISEVESLAKKSSQRSKKGSGGVPQKVRWYQLMSNLTQALDSVLRNIDLEDVKEKLDRLGVEMDELQKTASQAGG